MYVRYAERKRWKVETMSSNETGIGGIKEMSFKVRRQQRLQPVEI